MDKRTKLVDFFKKNYKLAFPIILIVLAAVTVVVALNIRKNNATEKILQEVQESNESTPEESSVPAEEVPLLQNTDDDIMEIVTAYYEAMGKGDAEAMKALCDTISETDILYYSQLAQYVDSYNGIEIYSKQGPVENSVVVYVYYKMSIINYGEVPGYETLYICTDADGKHYIKNEINFTEFEKDYIVTLCEQVDVVEFNNRVTVEYNELMANSPELLEYVGLLGEQIKAYVGEILAEQNASQVAQNPEETDPEGEENPGGTVVVGTAEPVPQYCTAKATVNVRSSDSEKADKLGKATKGMRLQVVEVKVNGWTKIIFEGKDGYIRSDLLRMEETAAGFETIGTVTATTNINIRVAGDETADRMGMLTEGESLELIAEENGWCKVKYNTQVGFVKAEYVVQTLYEQQQ